jgi:hypothetical protein
MSIFFTTYLVKLQTSQSLTLTIAKTGVIKTEGVLDASHFIEASQLDVVHHLLYSYSVNPQHFLRSKISVSDLILT